MGRTTHVNISAPHRAAARLFGTNDGALAASHQDASDERSTPARGAVSAQHLMYRTFFSVLPRGRPREGCVQWVRLISSMEDGRMRFRARRACSGVVRVSLCVTIFVRGAPSRRCCDRRGYMLTGDNYSVRAQSSAVSATFGALRHGYA